MNFVTGSQFGPTHYLMFYLLIIIIGPFKSWLIWICSNWRRTIMTWHARSIIFCVCQSLAKRKTYHRLTVFPCEEIHQAFEQPFACRPVVVWGRDTYRAFSYHFHQTRSGAGQWSLDRILLAELVLIVSLLIFFSMQEGTLYHFSCS